MTIYSRYEEVEVIRTPDDIHADVAGMMREAQQEVEATTLRETEQIVSVEPWGVESRVFPRADVDGNEAVLESRDVYSYRVTIDPLPATGSTGLA
jgi:hypothetical protein